MRLQAGRQSVTLLPLGYEFPDRASTGDSGDWDANWLYIGGDVSDGDLTWHFEDPCLTTGEARELLDWLRLVATWEGSVQNRPARRVLEFSEPNVRFALRDRTEDAATVVVSFAHESAPPGAGDDVRYGDGHGVAVELTDEALVRAADQWENDLAHVPER